MEATTRLTDTLELANQNSRISRYAGAAILVILAIATFAMLCIHSSDMTILADVMFTVSNITMAMLGCVLLLTGDFPRKYHSHGLREGDGFTGTQTFTSATLRQTRLDVDPDDESAHPRQLRWSQAPGGGWVSTVWGNPDLHSGKGPLPHYQSMKRTDTGEWIWVKLEKNPSLAWQAGPPRMESLMLHGLTDLPLPVLRPCGTAALS